MTTITKTHDSNLNEKSKVSKRPTLLHEFIEAQAKKSPFHTAFEIADEKLTYRELNKRANQVANYLVGKGVQPGDFIALYQDRSADLFICLLAVLKAGAAYLLIDPNSNTASVSNIVAKFEPKLILTNRQLSENFAPHASKKLVLVDEKEESFDALSSQNRILRRRSITADDSCYVAFTSDENGSFEHAAVEHRDSVIQVRSVISMYGLDDSHRCYQDHSLDFDVAVEEVCAMLSAGATIVLRNGDPSAAQGTTAQHLTEQKITLYSTVPGVLKTIDDELTSVTHLIIGGRPCSSDLAVSWALKKQRVVSMKASDNRFPSFSIDQEKGSLLRPRLFRSRSCKRMAA